MAPTKMRMLAAIAAAVAAVTGQHQATDWMVTGGKEYATSVTKSKSLRVIPELPCCLRSQMPS